MGDGMRAVKIAAVVMGVLILLGTAGLITALVLRKPGPASAPLAAPVAAPASVPGAGLTTGALPAGFEAHLDEPEGSRILGLTTVGDRIAVALTGGGPDRVVLIDPRTGGVAGRISLRR